MRAVGLQYATAVNHKVILTLERTFPRIDDYTLCNVATRMDLAYLRSSVQLYGTGWVKTPDHFKAVRRTLYFASELFLPADL